MDLRIQWIPTTDGKSLWPNDDVGVHYSVVTVIVSIDPGVYGSLYSGSIPVVRRVENGRHVSHFCLVSMDGYFILLTRQGVIRSSDSCSMDAGDDDV